MYNQAFALGLSLALGISGTAATVPGTYSIPLVRRSALAKRDGGYTTITNRPELGEYLVSVSIGTPPQSYLAQLDTGSSDIWVYAPKGCVPREDSENIDCKGGYCKFSYAKASKMNI